MAILSDDDKYAIKLFNLHLKDDSDYKLDLDSLCYLLQYRGIDFVALVAVNIAAVRLWSNQRNNLDLNRRTKELQQTSIVNFHL